jgi:hypothetical protein
VVVSDIRRLEHSAPYTNEHWDDFTFGGQEAGSGDAAGAALDRAGILDRAKELINGDRHDDYGSALDNHHRIARIWEVILGVDRITPSQVALCMAGLKMARLAFDPTKEDSWVDMAGYAALGGEMGSK